MPRRDKWLWKVSGIITPHEHRCKATHESGSINNAQPDCSLQRQVRLQCAVLPHRDRTHWVVDSVRLVTDIRVKLVVGLRLTERSELADDVVRPGGGSHEGACSFDSTAHDCDIHVCAQEVRVHQRSVERICGVQRDSTPCKRTRSVSQETTASCLNLREVGDMTLEMIETNRPVAGSARRLDAKLSCSRGISIHGLRINTSVLTLMISSKLAEVGPALGSVTFSDENTLEFVRNQLNWFVGGRPRKPVPLACQRASCSAARVALRWTSSSVKLAFTVQGLPRKT